MTPQDFNFEIQTKYIAILMAYYNFCIEKIRISTVLTKTPPLKTQPKVVEVATQNGVPLSEEMLKDLIDTFTKEGWIVKNLTSANKQSMSGIKLEFSFDITPMV